LVFFNQPQGQNSGQGLGRKDNLPDRQEIAKALPKAAHHSIDIDRAPVRLRTIRNAGVKDRLGLRTMFPDVLVAFHKIEDRADRLSDHRRYVVASCRRLYQLLSEAGFPEISAF